MAVGYAVHVHPLVKASCAVAILAAIGGPLPEDDRPAAPAAAPGAPLPPPEHADGQPIRCPDRALALDGRCVPLPDAEASLAGGARVQRIGRMPPSAVHLRTTAPHELIPRLPDRPEPWGDYQLPIDPFLAVDVPDLESDVAEPRLGIEIVAPDDQPVTLVDLQDQIGQAEVVLVGDLYGVTVVVRQRVRHPNPRDGDAERDYLLFYGNLERPGPSIVNGARLGPMAVIGYVAGDDDQGVEASLYFEVRQERSALSRPTTHLSHLVQSGVSVAVDPRNVLPLKR